MLLDEYKDQVVGLLNNMAREYLVEQISHHDFHHDKFTEFRDKFSPLGDRQSHGSYRAIVMDIRDDDLVPAFNYVASVIGDTRISHLANWLVSKDIVINEQARSYIRNNYHKFTKNQELRFHRTLAHGKDTSSISAISAIVDGIKDDELSLAVHITNEFLHSGDV